MGILSDVFGIRAAGRQALGEADGTVVTAIQLLHDEAEVRGELRSSGEAPEQSGNVHEDGQQQKDVRKELESSRKTSQEITTIGATVWRWSLALHYLM